MIYNSNNFAVHKLTAKTGGRPEFGGVYLTPKGTIATDNFSLISVSCPNNVKPADFPEKPNQPTKARQINAIIPKATAQKLEKELNGVKTKTLPILKNTIVSNFRDEKQVAFEITDLETWNTITSRVIEGQYPEWQDMIPKDEPKAEILVNADYLLRLVSILANTIDRDRSVKVKIFGNEKPIIFETKDDNQESLGLLMPIKGA